MLACGLALLGAGVLVALLTGAVGRSTAPAVVRVTPPAVPAVAPAPLAPTTLAGALSSGQSRGAAERAAIVGQHSRAEQARDWMWSEVTETLVERVRAGAHRSRDVDALEADVLAGRISPAAAARRLLDADSSGVPDHSGTAGC